MQFSTALLALGLISPSVAINAIEERQATSTDWEPGFSSAASQLISLYVPSSIIPIIASAASKASITGDPGAIVQSALIAPSPPSWLTAVPTEYSPNLVSLESKISELRSAASAGTIPGAPRVITSTDAAGSVVVTTSPGSVVSTTTGPSSPSGATSATKTSGSSSKTANPTTTSPSKNAVIVACSKAPGAIVFGAIGFIGAFAAL